MKKEYVAHIDCVMNHTMAIVGTKWKPIIIYVLRERKARFGQIAASIGTISRKVLTTALKELESDGLILREQIEGPPSRLEYSLTEKGLELLPVIYMLADWTVKHYYPEKFNNGNYR